MSYCRGSLKYTLTSRSSQLPAGSVQVNFICTHRYFVGRKALQLAAAAGAGRGRIDDSLRIIAPSHSRLNCGRPLHPATIPSRRESDPQGEPKRRRFFRGLFHHRNSQRASESLSVAPEIEVAPAQQPRAGTMFEPRNDIEREELAPRSQSMQIGPVSGSLVNDEPLKPQEFLFYGGTEHEQHYKPASSGSPEIDYKKIKPTLNKRMPVFFTPPVPNQTLRPSMVVVDTQEYEF